MKKYLILTLMTCSFIQVKAQNPIQSVLPIGTAPTFLNYSNVYKQELLSAGVTDTLRFKKKLERFNWLYDFRINELSEAGTNPFELWGKKTREYVLDRQTLCNKNEIFNGNWKAVGPLSLNRQNMGVVNGLWCDPSQSKNIMCCVFGGAIFKTSFTASTPITDLKWNAITDASTDLLPPGSAMYGLAVNPTNNDVIYCGTRAHIEGRSLHNWEGGRFGYGVIKSTDGGNTWVKETAISTLLNDEFLTNKTN